MLLKVKGKERKCVIELVDKALQMYSLGQDERDFYCLDHINTFNKAVFMSVARIFVIDLT